MVKNLFTEHGVEIISESELQHNGVCPFCDKKKFYYDPKKLLWDCKVCGRKGNFLQFLEQVYAEVYTPDERELSALSGKKGVPVEALIRSGIEFGNGQYVISEYQGERLEKLSTLTHFRLDTGPRATTGAKHGLFRPVGEDPMTKRCWIAEGVSDFAVMLHLVGDRESVYGMPGAGVFPPECCEIFRDRDVCVLLDNDNAGRNGAKLVRTRLKGVASSVHVLSWLPHSKVGEDVRDLFHKFKENTLSVIVEKRLGEPAVAGTDGAGLGEKAENKQERGRPTNASKLLDLCGGFETCRADDGEGYARYPVNEGHVVVKLHGAAFSNHLRREYFNKYGTTVSGQTITEVKELLEAQATAQRPVFQRYAEHNGEIWVNLGDGRSVRVTPNGWTVETSSPVWFYNSKSSRPMPTPTQGGSTEVLFHLINVPEAQHSLLLAWLVAAMRPRGPYPILSLQGEQGSAKTTTARLLRTLIDPSTPDQRSLSRDEREIITAAKNQHVLCFDNVSGVPVSISDALCRLATGSGQSQRKLYSDDDEVLFQGSRPIILNGIDDLGNRSDLLDRSILVTLPQIPPANRRDEVSINFEFELMHGRILGGLLDGVSMALKNIDRVHLQNKPRMADFALWAKAAEPAWNVGGFIAAYSNNASLLHDAALEANPIAMGIMDFMRNRVKWEGTSARLLEQLTLNTSEVHVRANGWAKDARHLGTIIKRIKPNLKHVGIEVTKGEWTRQGFIVQLAMTATSPQRVLQRAIS